MMIDCDYIKTNIDELMGIFCELHPDLSRSSRSQHRKAMLADWTKMSPPHVRVLAGRGRLGAAPLAAPSVARSPPTSLFTCRTR